MDVRRADGGNHARGLPNHAIACAGDDWDGCTGRHDRHQHEHRDRYHDRQYRNRHNNGDGHDNDGDAAHDYDTPADDDSAA